MFKKPSEKSPSKKNPQTKDMLSSEMAELEEIADRLFLRIEKRVHSLLEIEKRLDAKIARLEQLMSSNDDAPVRTKTPGNSDEIARLYAKGLKIDDIADILDIPRGEVELVLRLKK